MVLVMISITFRFVSPPCCHRMKRVPCSLCLRSRRRRMLHSTHLVIRYALVDDMGTPQLTACIRLCLVILLYLFLQSKSHSFCSLRDNLTCPRVFEMLMAFDALRLRNVIQLFGILCMSTEISITVSYSLSGSVPRRYACLCIHRNPRNSGCVVRAVRRLEQGRTIPHRLPNRNRSVMVRTDVVREDTVP